MLSQPRNNNIAKPILADRFNSRVSLMAPVCEDGRGEMRLGKRSGGEIGG